MNLSNARFDYLQLFFLTLIIFAVFPFFHLEKVKADCVNYPEKRYFTNMGGSSPSSNNSEISNCNEIKTFYNKKSTVQKSKDVCDPEKIITFSFCPRGKSSTANASGEVYIYSNTGSFKLAFDNLNDGTPLKNWNRSNIGSPFATGIFVNTGDKYKFYMGGADWNNGTGWRKIPENTTNATVIGFRNHAKMNGLTIISEQIWADDLTCSINSNDEPNDITDVKCSLYDSYDFDDQVIVIAVKNPAPSCNDYPLTLSVSKPAYHGDIAEFNVSITNESKYQFISNSYKIENNSSTFRLNISETNNTLCNPILGQTKCFIKNRGGYNAPSYKTNVNWTHNYKVCNYSACNACSESIDFQISPYPGYLRTDQGGTTYVAGKINQFHFPNNQSFTKYLLLTQQDSILRFIPTTQLDNTAIAKGYEYNDINNDNSFFNTFVNQLTNDQSLNLITKDSDINISQSYLNNLKATNTDTPVDLVYIKDGHNVTISENPVIYCKKPTIFLVSGNLNISTDFKINNADNTGCLFIVAKNTSFEKIGDAEIYAFIISNTVSTNIPGSTIIKGGLVLQGENQENNFNKNINATIVDANNIKKNIPSELINYEGARYIDLFGKYLRIPIKLSIREVGYNTW